MIVRAWLSFVTATFVVLFATASEAADPSIGFTPEVSFTAKEVFFVEPVVYFDADGKARGARVALKLLFAGEGFQAGESAPRYFIGDFAADRSDISPDGSLAAAYFFEPGRIRNRTKVRVQTSSEDVVTLKQRFELDDVAWLSAEIRARHKVPDLRAAIVGR